MLPPSPRYLSAYPPSGVTRRPNGMRTASDAQTGQAACLNLGPHANEQIDSWSSEQLEQ
jgi:hypothetical protein